MINLNLMVMKKKMKKMKIYNINKEIKEKYLLKIIVKLIHVYNNIYYIYIINQFINNFIENKQET